MIYELTIFYAFVIFTWKKLPIIFRLAFSKKENLELTYRKNWCKKVKVTAVQNIWYNELIELISGKIEIEYIVAMFANLRAEMKAKHVISFEAICRARWLIHLYFLYTHRRFGKPNISWNTFHNLMRTQRCI